MKINSFKQLPFDKYVSRFFQLIARFKDIIEEHDYPKKDVRRQSLTNCRSYALVAYFFLNIMFAHKNGIITEKISSVVFNLKLKLAYIVFEDFDHFVQLGYVTNFMFQVENLFKSILVKLEKKDPPKNFFCITKHLFEIISISEKEKKKDIIKAASWIRNSLHSNGTHTNETKTIDVAGIPFEFKNGDAVSCASWSHLHLVTNEILTILDEVISCSEVKGVKDTIPIRYIPDSL